ncbi:hypothetical protein ACJIZ3_002182 [Penstemon smallii]|uniref:Uncharacterized protein n=1 Tax=Penstemon smallii TaxID=265156 RepID=A0ABD3U5P9_9LAMI
MDAAKDIQSDLQALQKLYGLLQNVGDGMPNKASNSVFFVFKQLDENARLLLKNLLFAATQRALKAHSEMIAGRVEAGLWALSPTQLQHRLDEQPARLPIIGKSCGGSDQESKVDGLDVTLWTEQRFTSKGSQVSAMEQSTPSLGASRGEPEYRTKRCRVCQKTTVKQQQQQLESIKDSNLYDVAQNSNRFIDRSLWNSEQETASFLVNKTDDSKGNLRFVEECNSDVQATNNKPEEADCLSKEASEAIKQIELCISALQIGEGYLFEEESSAQNRNFVEQRLSEERDYPLHEVPSATKEEMNLPYLTKLVQPNNTRSRGHALGSYLSDEMGDSIEEHKLPILGQNVRAFIEKIESGNYVGSRDTDNFVPRQIPNVQNFSFPPHHNEISNRTLDRPVTFSSASKTEIPDQSFTATKDKSRRKGNVQTLDSGLNVSPARGANGKKHPPNSRWETLMDKKPAQLSVTKKYTRHQESESIASSSDSLNWSSQEASSYVSDSEEYSLPSRTQRLHYETQSTSNDSGSSPLSQGTESQYGSSTSNGEDEIYSSMSGDGDCEATSSSISNSEEYSSYDQPINHCVGPKYLSMESTSRKEGPRRFRKPDKKQTGTWKRLKDKLSVIFHHHHHHHHHHHDDRKISIQKHKGKAFHSKRDNEAYAEKGVEKMRKSVIQDKNQKKHFHGLMEALLGHVRHSKKSKTAKEKIGPLTKGGQHGNKKALKKSHWWQLLQQHREANKTHAKLGGGKRKAFPKLK